MEKNSHANSKIISVKVIARSAQTEHAGIMADGTFKIRVKAAPEHGRANEELIRFLADEYKVNTSQIKLVTGAKNSRKLFKINFDS